jgi:hypothetical protein
MTKEHRYNSPTVRAIMDEAEDAPAVLERTRSPNPSSLAASVFVAIAIGVNAFLFGLVAFG